MLYGGKGVKGLQFERVMVIIDRTRRLFYVTCSRAIDSLVAGKVFLCQIIQLSYLLFLSRISRCVATSVISATSEIILSLNVYRGQFAFVRSVSRLLIFTPYRSW